jgi:hypothetical protein
VPSQPLESAFDTLRARLQAELDAQLAAIQTHHAQAVGDARRAAEAAADERWAGKLSALRAELSAAAAAPADRGRSPLPATSSVDTEPRPAMRRLANALARISEATSLSAVLDRLGAASALEAGRTALFVVNGASLHRWQTSGFAAGEAPEADLMPEGALADVLRTGLPGASSGGAAPPFAADATGLVIPLLVGDRAVAVLYADDAAGAREGDRWQDAVGILGQHAAACLARITAIRTSEAFGDAAPQTETVPPPAAAAGEDESSARRYARLLVSEIKLYNESAVRAGRERNDILSRLKPEIDRARRLYEDRVPSSVRDRAQVFQQELVQTLAGGDPALLGASV